MKVHLSVMVVFALLGAKIFAIHETTQNGAPLLTLSEALDVALQNSFRVLDSDDAITQTALGLSLARSEFRPKITPNVLGSFGQTDVSNQTYGLDVSQRLPTGTALRATFGSITSQNQLGNFYSSDTTFQVSQSLLRGFGREVATRGLRSAEARVDEARRNRIRTDQQLAVEVAAAYYAVGTQQQLADLAQQTLERSRTLLEASIAKLEIGKVSQLDLFRAQQLVAQAEGQLLDARAAVDEAEDQLRFLMGRDIGFEFRVEPPPAVDPETISIDEALELARTHRPELEGAQAALAEAERELGYSRNQLLPQVDVNLALTRRETATSLRAGFGLDGFQPATFLTVSMPVDRTPQTVAYQNASINVERQRRELSVMRLTIEREARRAVRQQQRLAQSLAVAGARVEFAEKEVELATFRYQRGLSNNLDVVNAEANLLAARAERAAMLAELAVARLQLRATLGTLNPRSDVK